MADVRIVVAQDAGADGPATPTTIHSEDRGDRDGRLAQMGLNVEQLERVVQAGVGGFASTTAFHPRSTPGTYLYHEATAAFRRAVKPSGFWDFDEDDNQPRTFSETYGIAVVVQTGDENTGLINQYEPKARNPKGQATQKKVASNHDQPMLFHMTPRQEDDGSPFSNWVLLIAIVAAQDGLAVRSELSLPRKMVGNKPCGWLERIILPEAQVGDAEAVVNADGGESSPATDIDVVWKQ